jgi:uncharacterized damage-inducible protein DinB
MATKNSEIGLLLEIIDQAFDHHAWHGTNLRGSVRGLTKEEASWRPGPHRHNIWEVVVHAAYWKYAVRRRILGEKRGSFPLKGSNWFPRPDTLSGRSWREDVALLDSMHEGMRKVIEQLSPKLLQRIQGKTKYTYAQLIYGIASHDLYHAGQIQLLKRLHKGR